MMSLLVLGLAACATVPAGTVTEHQTKSTRAVVQRYLASAEAGDADAAAALFADDAVYRDKTFDFEIRGTKAIRSMLSQAFAMLRPATRTVISQAYDGPNAAIEWEAVGTHVAPTMGIPATNKEITVRGVSLITVKDEKIQSVTDFMDRAGLERQLKR